MESQAWYHERSHIAARAFTTEISWAIRVIQESPTRWKRHIKNTHKFELNHFPFSIIYRINEDSIEIVAVAHQRRRPGYWRKR